MALNFIDKSGKSELYYARMPIERWCVIASKWVYAMHFLLLKYREFLFFIEIFYHLNNLCFQVYNMILGVNPQIINCLVKLLNQMKNKAFIQSKPAIPIIKKNPQFILNT